MLAGFDLRDFWQNCCVKSHPFIIGLKSFIAMLFWITGGLFCLFLPEKVAQNRPFLTQNWPFSTKNYQFDQFCQNRSFWPKKQKFKRPVHVKFFAIRQRECSPIQQQYNNCNLAFNLDQWNFSCWYRLCIRLNVSKYKFVFLTKITHFNSNFNLQHIE